MTYAFAGVIGRGGQLALDSLHRALGGVGGLIETPFAGFVHCVSNHVGYDFSETDRAALLSTTRAFPNETFAWIEVECFGGVCGQLGFVARDGVVIHNEPPAEDTATNSVLQRLLAKMGVFLPASTFEPFARGFFKWTDEAWMSRAVALSRRGLGRVAPNPSVGCVIVHNGAIVGEGSTGDGGRPHAEEIALRVAGDLARDATAYVSLEPCNARSSGALSCSQLMIEAGIERVVIACEDPHPLGAHGVSRLGAAGVEVMLGVLRSEAEALNCGFFKLTETGRPWLAIDADPSTYDGEFDLKREESYEAALDRLGKQGLTRIFVRPGTPLTAQLKARGLIDADNSQK